MGRSPDVAVGHNPTLIFTSALSIYTPHAWSAGFLDMAPALQVHEEEVTEKCKGKRKVDDLNEDGEGDMPSKSPRKKRNKQRVLLLSSRGITHRMRHFMNDLGALLPHVKKGVCNARSLMSDYANREMCDGCQDSKLDSKNHLHLLPELADLHSCNNTLYFEARRHEDLYLWAAKTPNGPSIKLHVQNVHTMDELKMTGNCLKGSRGVLSFDAAFEETEWGRLTKELFTHVSVVRLVLVLIIMEKQPRSAHCCWNHRYLECRRRLGEPNRSSTISSRSPSLTPRSGSEISRSGTTF